MMKSINLRLKAFVVSAILLLCFSSSLYAQKGHYRIKYLIDLNKNIERNICRDNPFSYYYYLSFFDVSGNEYRRNYTDLNNRGFFHDIHNESFDVPIDKKIIRSRFKIYVHQRAAIGCNGYLVDQDLNYNISAPTGCSSYGQSNFHYDNEDHELHIFSYTHYDYQISPIIETIVSKAKDGQDNDVLPDVDSISLLAPKGFDASAYNWEYRIGLSGFWQSFPTSMNVAGKDSISFSGNDLISNYKDVLNSGDNIFFRAKSCSADYSSILTLKPRISSPHISSVTPIPNTCFGETNGSMIIQFDRALLPNELLNVLITDTSDPGKTYANIQNVSVFEAGNKLTYPSVLAPGQFKIELIGKYPNSSISTYTDGVAHVATTAFTGPAAVDFNLVKRDIYCYNGQDGTITVNANGGNGAYQVFYKKQEAPNYIAAIFSSAGQHVITGLDPGTYQVKVADQNGCYKKDAAGNEVISTVTITQPTEALHIDFRQITNPLSFGASNGSIEAIVVGGTQSSGNYTIKWTDESGNNLTNFTVINNPFKTVLNNVGDGKYTLNVTDNNYASAQVANAAGCMVVEQFVVKQPQPLDVSLIQTQNVSCYAEANAVLYAKASGCITIPAQKYKYQWSKQTGANFTMLSQTDSVLSNLGAGIYKVKITDQNNISKESEPFNLTEPTALDFTVSKRDVYCYGGQDATITIQATGGNGSYQLQYKKQDDAAYTQIAFSTAAQHTLTSLDVGTYSIRVTDQNGCVKKDAAGDEVTATVTITQPAAALQISAREITNPTAFGYTDGNVQATIIGGTPNAGSYTVQWTDINGNTLSNVSNSSNPFKTVLNTVPDGKYILKVTDSNFNLAEAAHASSCVVIDTFVLKQPDPLVVSLSQYKYISCSGDADGQLYAKATGGIIIPGQKYVYQWYKEVAGVFTVFNQTDSIATELKVGVYKIKVTDKNNISKESLPFNLAEPMPLKITLSATAVICSGDRTGTVTVNITGGTAPYHIEWSTGDNTNTVKELADGQYVVFVTDAHGCQVQGQVQVTAPNPIAINNVVVKQPTCFGSADGSITHVVTGGTAPYTYLWNNGATTANLSNLSAGTYILNISEINGCSKSVTYILSNPAAVKVDLGPDVTLCVDQTHTIDASIADGAIYKWTSTNGFSASTAKVTLSNSGTYYLEASTSKGCIGRDTIVINKSTAVIASEFVVATQAFKGETVNLINISSPAPQSVTWMVPEDKNISIVSKTNETLQLRFAETGNYTISLKANVGDCYRIFTKQISVVAGTSFNDPGTVKEPFIKSFIIAPNPSNGNFNAKIELQEAARIKLRLLNTITGQLIDTREDNGSNKYNLPYNLTLSTGMYVMILETPTASMVYKVLIQ